MKGKKKSTGHSDSFASTAEQRDPGNIPYHPPYTEAPFYLGVPFTDEDRGRIEAVAAIAPGLSALLGQHCEIVVHSLEHPEKAVVASANARLSGREVGASIARRGLDVILDILASGSSFYRYFPTGPRGQRVKSVIIPIRNPAGRCLGVLSIGQNLEMPFADFILDYVNARTEAQDPVPLFAGGHATVIERSVADAWREALQMPDLSQRGRVRQVVRVLYENDIFNLRDAVNVVSERLGVSQATVYLHLRELKKKND